MCMAKFLRDKWTFLHLGIHQCSQENANPSTPMANFSFKNRRVSSELHHSKCMKWMLRQGKYTSFFASEAIHSGSVGRPHFSGNIHECRYRRVPIDTKTRRITPQRICPSSSRTTSLGDFWWLYNECTGCESARSSTWSILSLLSKERLGEVRIDSIEAWKEFYLWLEISE